jgi:hypothetical protein
MRSLRRLRVETIDLYQIHWPDPEPDIEEGWETLARLKEEKCAGSASPISIRPDGENSRNRSDHVPAAALLDRHAGNCCPAWKGHFNHGTELKVFATFQDEVRQGILLCQPITQGIAAAALNLLSIVPYVRMRTLDAFHLAIAREIQASLIATTDRVMIAAAVGAGHGRGPLRRNARQTPALKSSTIPIQERSGSSGSAAPASWGVLS